MIARLLCAAALCAAAFPAAAQDDAGPAPQARGPVLLRIEVGQTVSLGAAMGTPVTCDDGSLVERTSGPSGLALRGLKPGTTNCSLVTAAFTTVRYRVRVVEPPPAPSK
ncbi:MAG TPA: hypothetical protein VN874_05285 [Myxococcales bacterium]|jgi:hypothetical protein|nr:hypothetical protein [Myxococcales bacterium]